MTATKTLTVKVLHRCSIPFARWCEPVGWEPSNEIDGSEFSDGSWWDDQSQTAGLVCFGHAENGDNEVTEVNLDDLLVASCGECRIIGEVKL